jgi:predicted nuclease with TOPRIM domain
MSILWGQNKGTNPMAKNNVMHQERTDSARVVAGIVGMSTSYVQKVRNDIRTNEEVLATLIDYETEKKAVIEKLKQRQELYRAAAASGRLKEAYELESEIDELQNRFEELRNNLIEEFHAGC